MYAKIIIKAELVVLTGMHIGGASGFSAIGAVDSPVIRDPRTNQPIIPGSSLKGKLRTLLVRSIYRDISKLPEPNKDPEPILRLFGSSAEPVRKSRLQFADAFVSNAEEFRETGLTEIKFENTIDRVNGKANPRQIERVNRGVRFDVRIVYDLLEERELEEDMQNLAKGLKLIQLDYLGGHGTRGSGRVSFRNIRIVPFEDKDKLLEKHKDAIMELFKEVEEYELFNLKATVS
jgi:CRISPR-associated protein Csm3